MKLVKMSMVAALVLGANVYAIDNVKVNGDAKLYYQTVDSDAANAPDMFDKDASNADAALHLGLTADLTTGVSAGVSMTAVSTLGLENNLVSGTWSNAHSATTGTGASFLNDAAGGASVDDEMWVGEAWIAGTAGKTTAKLGRQAVDTPLAFTETWGIDQNTFEAVVLINQDLPDTTLVGAWIGKSNGSAADQAGIINTLGAASAGYVAESGKFNTFAKDGAYAVGAINNSFKPLTAQAWYYDLVSHAQAYWLQADLNMGGILAGAQYASVDVTDADILPILAAGVDSETTAYSVMLGYEMKDVVTVKAAYSSVSDDSAVGVGNTATTTQQSKLYTEMWWNYAQVSAVGADSFSVTAEGTAAGVDLLLGFYSSEQDTAGANDLEVTEIALTASKSFGPLDATLALINDDFENETLTANDHTDTTLQVYLTYNF
jgi:hypothetical protein